MRPITEFSVSCYTSKEFLMYEGGNRYARIINESVNCR